MVSIIMCSPGSVRLTYYQVFAINPTEAKSFAAFQAAAMATNTTSPAGQNPSGSVVTSAVLDGPVSAGTVSGAAPTATSGSNSTGTNTTGGSSPANTNAAMKMSGSSVSLLAVAGLFAGLAL